MLFVLLFPAVGIGLAIWAIRATVRFKRFGAPRASISRRYRLPWAGPLRGTVVAAGSLDVRDGLLLTPACVRRVITGSREEPLHQRTDSVAGGATCDGSLADW